MTTSAGRWRQHMQIDHAVEIGRMRPCRLVPLQALSFGFTHGTHKIS